MTKMTGADLRRRREALGLSKYRLAKRLGLSQSTVGRWESGLQNIERAGTMLDAAIARLEAQMRQEENGRDLAAGFDEAGVRNGSIIPPTPRPPQ